MATNISNNPSRALHDGGQPSRVVASVRVLDVRKPCREHVWVEFDARSLPASEPGQFLQVVCAPDAAIPDHAVDWTEGRLPQLSGVDWQGRTPQVRRPFSIADRWTAADGGDRAAIISRAIGPGTRWLDNLQPGAMLSITGPLGVGFAIPPIGRPLVLIGGGVGIPPFLYLARRLLELGHRDLTLIFGVQSRDLMPIEVVASPAPDGAASACLRLPSGDAPPAIVTTDDGSLGLRGRVTDALAAWLKQRGESGRAALVYACGPEPMLHAVARQTRAESLECQLCIERLMGCGLGTCLSCIVQTPCARSAAGWRWTLSCSSGPVFDRDALIEFAH